ncbi:hypothetical protein TKK_0013994 [Trichogramma kaykai]|uniref:GPI transamidase component PIG-S n=1 Tax=Trichogramma kaykai TaxID=54128 RepID=A0ABD2WFC5_9HYME
MNSTFTINNLTKLTNLILLYLEKRCRIYASISFAVLLLGVGLPLWWETTAVPRAPVNHRAISALQGVDVRLHMHVLLGCANKERSADLAVEFMRRLTHSGSIDIYKLTVEHFSYQNTSILRARSVADLDRSISTFDLKPGDLMILEVKPEVLGKDIDVWVTNHRAIYYSEKSDRGVVAKVIRQWIYREPSLSLTRNAIIEPEKFSLNPENRQRFPASPNYDILLTIVNPQPEEMKVNSSIANIVPNYFEPFLQGLKNIADFSVKSQWLYLLPLGVKPKQLADSSKWGKHYALPEDVLPQIITPLEKKLASQVSLHPTINLVMYIVPCSEAPLYIYDQNGQRQDVGSRAFHSPRWGGIVLVNPSYEFCTKTKTDKVFTPDELFVTGIFLQHLKLLIGVTDKMPIPRVYVADPYGLELRLWEIDDILRIRAIEQLTSAKLTLQSLSKLLKEISNIVITDTVGNRITRALDLVKKSAQLLDEADLVNGFLTSKEAFVVSEAAFSDPSLLALLYFPDDQKYAVYIPLFLPVMIPVLFSLKNIKNYLFCSD